MAPRAKPKAKGKAKAKATVKEPASPKKKAESATLPVKGGTGLDLEALQGTLEKWNAAKKQEEEAKKIIESCKTEVETTMMKTGMSVIKTATFEVSKRSQTRESVSKADLPADVWKKYAKMSEFTVLALKDLGKAKGKKA
mmetsp:Transcript_125942/g.350887  ORF Transcript_125942/g.350887 Transcript_125942/m.350887 type:complete len:140 (+) Transcript_125942:61-480(+)|eukprot:CAMPEP_0179096168 /NCGR_PEP_ID=MMETSP0796-20121207/44192_1 /TAXON_ID=73915 /ORGANISM="Pyrodinium bahamense, Strain pbaha01" /LENGTH=139 /DNA_ID=CAMNT_0020793873 /DNA_START=54 /DNA_END=473 /DNA_ORIENTATION=-